MTVFFVSGGGGGGGGGGGRRDDRYRSSGGGRSPDRGYGDRRSSPPRRYGRYLTTSDDYHSSCPSRAHMLLASIENCQTKLIDSPLVIALRSPSPRRRDSRSRSRGRGGGGGRSPRARSPVRVIPRTLFSAFATGFWRITLRTSGLAIFCMASHGRIYDCRERKKMSDVF
jgi:hypothetical protein